MKWLKKTACFWVFLGIASWGQAYELKTHYQEGFPKYFLTSKDGKQEVGGLCVEIMHLIEKKASDIRFVAEKRLVVFKRIKYDLLKGKIDVYLGIVRNSEREKHYIYIDQPLYQLKYVVAVRRNDSIKVNTFDDIRALGMDGKILITPGTAAEKYLKQQGGLQIDSGGNSVSLNLVKLLKKRGRFVYSHNLGLISTIRNDGLIKQVKTLPASFKTYYHYMAFSKKAPKGAIQRVHVINSTSFLKPR